MTAGGSILAEKKNGKWQQYLYDGSGQLMAIRYKGADYYYIRDGLVRVVIQNFLKKPVISTVFKADE